MTNRRGRTGTSERLRALICVALAVWFSLPQFAASSRDGGRADSVQIFACALPSTAVLVTPGGQRADYARQQAASDAPFLPAVSDRRDSDREGSATGFAAFRAPTSYAAETQRGRSPPLSLF